MLLLKINDTKGKSCCVLCPFIKVEAEHKYSSILGFLHKSKYSKANHYTLVANCADERGQTDKQKDRRTDRKTDRQRDIQTDIQTD